MLPTTWRHTPWSASAPPAPPAPWRCGAPPSKSRYCRAKHSGPQAIFVLPISICASSRLVLGTCCQEVQHDVHELPRFFHLWHMPTLVEHMSCGALDSLLIELAGVTRDDGVLSPPPTRLGSRSRSPMVTPLIWSNLTTNS